MQLSINIEDSYLQEQIANYISEKQIQIPIFSLPNSVWERGESWRGKKL